MGKIVVSENTTLDGVVQDPTGDEGFRHGGWFSQSTDHDREQRSKVELDGMLRAEALLLGRRSEAFFAARWQSRTGEMADRFNGIRKYVVSSTLDRPIWNNSTVLAGDLVTEVSKLKRELDGELLVYASVQLVHALIEHDLLDELRLTVYPIVLGTGERLFDDISDKKSLRLLHAEALGEGLAYLTYEFAQNATEGTDRLAPVS